MLQSTLMAPGGKVHSSWGLCQLSLCPSMAGRMDGAALARQYLFLQRPIRAGQGEGRTGQKRGGVGPAKGWGRWWFPPLDPQPLPWAGQPNNGAAGVSTGKTDGKDLRSPIAGFMTFPFPEETPVASANPLECSSSYFATTTPTGHGQLKIGLQHIT